MKFWKCHARITALKPDYLPEDNWSEEDGSWQEAIIRLDSIQAAYDSPSGVQIEMSNGEAILVLEPLHEVLAALESSEE